jgi:uncharacterized protein (DUF488 family)
VYYRRKVILALLESFNGELGKISFQKLLFLFTRYQEKPAFDFVPYNYGCFSFQSYADMRTMIKYNMVSEDKEKWLKADEVNYTAMLIPKDKQVLLYIKNKFGKSTKEELIEYTYKNYPFYAFKSIIAKTVLNKAELKTVKETVVENNKTILYTIGYEGISLETYLNKLILNNVKMLCDVRKNSLSMKYGFSKSQLQKACENLSIKYLHIPDLGIDSDKRQSLNSQNDYDFLFKEYAKTTLVAKKTKVQQVLDILESNKRIALTCFEAHECQCHRGTLAKAITKLPEWKYELKHL